MLRFLLCVGFQRNLQRASGYLQLIVCQQDVGHQSTIKIAI